MKVVDTSVWASIFLKTDVNNRTARQWLANLPGDEKLLSPTLAYIELACTLARVGNTASFVKKCLARLQEIVEPIPLTTEIVDLGVKIGIDCKTKGADTVFIASAQFLDSPLVTLDKEQAERGNQKIKTFLLPSMS